MDGSRKPNNFASQQLGVAAGIVFTPIAFFLSLIHIGPGRGDLWFAALLFPVQTLVIGLTYTLSPIVLAAAALKYPITGFVIDWSFARSSRCGAAAAVGLCCFHLTAVITLLTMRFG